MGGVDLRFKTLAEARAEHRKAMSEGASVGPIGQVHPNGEYAFMHYGWDEEE
jgi:hypothetical protein